MPDATSLQNVVAIVLHSLTERPRAWLSDLCAGRPQLPEGSVVRHMLNPPSMRSSQGAAYFYFPRLLAVCCLVFVALAADARAETPAAYMNRVANELLAASRSGSANQFHMVIENNADLKSIGITALGPYARGLGKSDRDSYYDGLSKFIARYAAREAPNYPVDKIIVTSQSRGDTYGIYVDTRIKLARGDSYDVRWHIVRRGNRYKVRNVQVLGFWITSYLDTLFQNFISENGGNPRSLVATLNK